MALNFALPRVIRNSSELHDSAFHQDERADSDRLAAVASKVPQVAIAFWVIARIERLVDAWFAVMRASLRLGIAITATIAAKG